MQNINKVKILYFSLLITFFFGAKLSAQEEVVKLHYYNENNNLQYLFLEANRKEAKILTPLPNKEYKVFLNTNDSSNLISAIKTDNSGRAKLFLPISLKESWNNNSEHTFIVEENEKEIISDFIINKAKIEIDTFTSDEGQKSIKAIVTKLVENKWLPADEVEMKLGIKRVGGILPSADEQSYTTDSSGTVVAEFKKDKIPGDENGNITLIAKVEENENFGNLSTEKIVNWGITTQVDSTFFEKRTLWSTRFKTPYWLLTLAYSIAIGIWATLIYLVYLVVKIVKLGNE